MVISSQNEPFSRFLKSQNFSIELGHRDAYLIVSSSNLVALTLYLSFGFRSSFIVRNIYPSPHLVARAVIEDEDEEAGWLCIKERLDANIKERRCCPGALWLREAVRSRIDSLLQDPDCLLEQVPKYDTAPFFVHQRLAFYAITT